MSQVNSVFTDSFRRCRSAARPSLYTLLLEFTPIAFNAGRMLPVVNGSDMSWPLKSGQFPSSCCEYRRKSRARFSRSSSSYPKRQSASNAFPVSHVMLLPTGYQSLPVVVPHLSSIRSLRFKVSANPPLFFCLATRNPIIC